MKKTNTLTIPLLMLATIGAGMLSPMQSAVNGKLGEYVQDGNLCAVISFASGLIIMFAIILSNRTYRNTTCCFAAMEYAAYVITGYFAIFSRPARWLATCR